MLVNTTLGLIKINEAKNENTEEQNKILVNFDKTFDPMNFADCVNRAILLLKIDKLK